MAGFDTWLTGVAQTQTDRATLAWNRISQKPSSITFKKPNGTTLAAQTVRVEVNNNASMAMELNTGGPVRGLVIFGIRGHATLTDSDIREGYRFIYDNDEYRIIDTILTLGEIQANAEQTG